MHNTNASAASHRKDSRSPAAFPPKAANMPANTTRGPLVVLRGGASARFFDASPDTPAISRQRAGFVAECIGIIDAAVTAIRTKREVRKQAGMRRMADRELDYLSTHILKDIGLSGGRSDVFLRKAALHGLRS